MAADIQPDLPPVPKVAEPGAEGERPMAAELPPVLTIDEVATLLRVGRASAYRAARRGELPGCVRLGKTLRVHRDKLLSWLEQGQAPTTRRRHV